MEIFVCKDYDAVSEKAFEVISLPTRQMRYWGLRQDLHRSVCTRI